MGYTCPRCHDTFLFQPDQCPTCAADSSRKQRSSRARERRASYDTQGKISESEFWQLLRLYPCCPSCGEPWERTEGAIARDHIIPISRGGPNTSANIQPLCQTCNLWKSDRLIYFDRALPGRVTALPAVLRPIFAAIDDYQPQTNQQQLSFISQSDEVAYPNATPEALERQTISQTWQAIEAERPTTYRL